MIDSQKANDAKVFPFHDMASLYLKVLIFMIKIEIKYHIKIYHDTNATPYKTVAQYECLSSEWLRFCSHAGVSPILFSTLTCHPTS